MQGIGRIGHNGRDDPPLVIAIERRGHSGMLCEVVCDLVRRAVRAQTGIQLGRGLGGGGVQALCRFAPQSRFCAEAWHVAHPARHGARAHQGAVQSSVQAAQS